MKADKKRRKRRYKNTPMETLCIILFCAPAVLHLLIFWLGVQIENVRMMFTDYDTGKFSLINFQWAINSLNQGLGVNDINLAFRNTMIFFVMGLCMIPVCLFTSYLIYRKVFGHTFIRLALYLPGAVCGIMMPLIYEKLMGSEGPICTMIQNIRGVEEPVFFMLEHPMTYIILFDVLIGIGGNMVVWMGSMSRIPYDLIEYGKLEGIKPWREFGSVVLPLIWPTFVTVVSLQMIGMFGASGSVMVLTDGRYDTYTLSFWMYKMVRDAVASEMNHVAALGMLFTLMTIPLLIIFRTIMNKFGGEVEY